VVISTDEEILSCTDESIDPNIPQILFDIYDSGTSTYATTVSNFFDIGWRQMTKRFDLNINNAQPTDKGAFRFLDAFLLDDSVRLVEGLIVDSIDGGIGLRNHSIPEGFNRGAEWSEDLLFLDVDVECVDTNMTIDFGMSTSTGDFGGFQAFDVVLTDRGGFSNINKTSPVDDVRNNEVNKPDLQLRAYAAAWFMNVASMLLLNASTPTNESDIFNSWTTIDSEVGTQFELPQPELIEDFVNLQITTELSKHLGVLFTDDWGEEPIEHPWSITSDTFDDICELLCLIRVVRIQSGLTLPPVGLCELTASGASLKPNSTYVACNLIRGTPGRVDGGQGAVFDDESRWSTPLHICASAPKATIKTVRFLINDTASATDLSSLKVTEIKDKVYEREEDMPSWGIEQWDLRLNEINPIWGLVDRAFEGFPNVTTLRQPSLYLLGSSDDPFRIGFDSYATFDNIPGAVGPLVAMHTIRGSGSLLDDFDFVGRSSMGQWLKWRELSKSSDTAGKVIKLLWTDLAASAMVGTKGIHDFASDRTEGQTLDIPVFPIRHRVQYNYLFGIPALVVALCVAVIAILATVLPIIKKSGVKQMDQRLKQTSTGRILTTIMHPETSNFYMSSDEWSEKNGERDLNLRPYGPEPEPRRQSYATVKSPQTDKRRTRSSEQVIY
jgi:hypothetical protein